MREKRQLCKNGIHNWVYDDVILTSYPAQIRRICKDCGESETIVENLNIKYGEKFSDIYKRFYG